MNFIFSVMLNTGFRLMFTTKIPNVKVASATVYSNTCKNVLLIHPYRIETKKRMRCLIQTIAFFHLSIRILQCCTSHSFIMHIAMFLQPIQTYS